MTHAEKIEHLIKDLRNRGVDTKLVAPPLYRLLWRVGWQVRPPLFQNFLVIFLVMGIQFGVGFGLCIWLFDLAPAYQDAWDVVVDSVKAGVGFGLGIAMYYRWKAYSLELPEWEEYPDAYLSFMANQNKL